MVAAKPATPSHPIWLIGVVATSYMIFSIVVVMLNKKCFAMGEHYPFPLATTLFQFLIAIVCTILIDVIQKSIGKNFVPLLRYNLKEIVQVTPVSLAFIAMIATGNMCLSYLQISFFQTAKSLHIVISLVLSFLMGDKHSFAVAIWALLVTVGWVISTSGEPSAVFSVTGLVWGVVSSFMVALYPLVLKRAMSSLDRWQLQFNVGVMSILILIPVVALSSEGDGVIKSPMYGVGWFWQLMMLTAVAGFLLNIAAMANVHYSSPLSHMIAGSMKGVVQSALAWAFFNNEITLIGGLGSLLCVVAIFGYSYTRYLEGEAAKKRKQ